jgi:heptose I phosphotransferase
MIYVREDLRPLFETEQTVSDFMNIGGEVVKHVIKSRRITRFERQDRMFYMKCHYGVGWAEIFKNLLTLRLPVTSAHNEWQALNALQQLGIDSMSVAAFGSEGWNPASRRSFIITDALTETEDVEQWLAAPGTSALSGEQLRAKRGILRAVGNLAGKLHASGINHRDFYLCHFRLHPADLAGLESEEIPQLYLMDLHRAQIRRRVPLRWLVKDLAGLLYSGMYSPHNLPLTLRDYLRLLEAYCGIPWRQCLRQRRQLWEKVLRRALRDARKEGRGTARLEHMQQHLAGV